MEQQILDLVSTNLHLFKTIGYYFVMLASFVESLPVIGFVVPGQSIIIVAGFLAKKHLVGIWGIFLVATFGAILGDVFAFFLGKKYGESLLKKHGGKFFIKESLIQQTKTLVNTHPGKTLFFGRLNSVTRSLSPFVAGMSEIKTSTFLSYCIGGCILWAGIFVSIGYVFGRSFEIIAPIIGKFILTASIIVVLLILLVNFMKKRGFTLSKYHIQMLVTNIISLYVFVGIGEAIAKGGRTLFSFDEKLRYFVGSLHNPLLNKFFLLLSLINTKEFVAIIGVLCFLLIAKGRVKDFYLEIIAILSGFFFVFFSKMIFDRARPIPSMLVESGFSFPSGHAVIATIFFLIIIHNYASGIKSELKRFFFISTNVFLIFLFSFSRLYLGVHYASDVIAGIAMGSWIFSLTILASRCAPWFYNKIKREQIIPNL